VKRRRASLGAAAALAAGLGGGCASVVAKQADLDAAPDGIRVYAPRACLLVDVAANTTVIAYFPDPARAYDLKPRTVLARQELRVELEAGQLVSFTSSQDTTAFPRLLTEAAELAAAAGAGVSASAPLKGSFGFSDGVHCMRDDGSFAP
jgi:hypothetical protein